MTIFRIQKDSNYSIISNIHINDDRLSWKATAILTYLLSKPDNWTIYIKQLAKAKKCGIKAVYSGVKELRELGYIKYITVREDNARIIRGEYLVYEVPLLETPTNIESKPDTQNRKQAFSSVENGDGIIKTDSSLKTDFKKTTTTTEQNVGQNIPSSSSSDTESKPLYPNKEIPLPGITKHDVNNLIQSIPESKRSKPLEILLDNAILMHTSHDIKSAILYTLANSKGSKSAFKSYLGKTLENGWGEGFTIEKPSNLTAAEVNKQRGEEEEKKKHLQTRRSNILDYQSKYPDEYKLLEQKAADELQYNLKRLKPGQLQTIRFKIMEYLNL